MAVLVRVEDFLKNNVKKRGYTPMHSREGISYYKLLLWAKHLYMSLEKLEIERG